MPKTRSQKRQQSPPAEDVSTADLCKLLQESLNKTRWRPTIKPPTFSGKLSENPERFLKKLEKLFEESDLEEEDYVEVARNQLTGDARTWCAPLEKIELIWKQFRSRFLAQFDGTKSRIKVINQLYSQAQGANESGREFITQKIALWQRDPTIADTDMQLQSTTQLLRPDFRLALAGRDVSTFEELLNTVETIDEALQAKANETRPRSISCRYCGGGHYSPSCPTMPSTSKNAGNA